MEHLEEQNFPAANNIELIELPTDESIKDLEIELLMEQSEEQPEEQLEEQSEEQPEEHLEEQNFPSVENIVPIELPTDESAKEKDIQLLKYKAQKVKVIALELLHKPVFSNPSQFTKREKEKLLRVMKEWFDKSDEIVNQFFNEIVLDKIDSEYEKIYIEPKDITYAPDPEFHRNLPPMDIAGNTIKTSN